MNSYSIDSSWIVQNVLDEFPALLPVFTSWKLDCLGCSMSSFCNIQEVAEDYHLNLDQFLQELNAAISQSNH
jgi:hybrid cluster-associated redox disulfide protein